MPVEPVPRVSVMIPCYNLGAYLCEDVDSVLAQTFQDFEILVVDDGSTDPATVELLDRFDRPKTTVFRTPNQGLAAARNHLVAKARGEFLCALDADDRLHPEYLARTLAPMAEDPSIGFVSTRMQMFGAETREWPDDLRCDLETLLCHDPVHCAALVRRSAVLGVGGYDVHMGHQGNEDWDLWLGIAETGLRGLILDEVLFYYRRREGSMSTSCALGDQHLQAVRHLVRKHEASYRAHWPAVAAWKDREVALVEGTTRAYERDLHAADTALALRRDELAHLSTRLDRLQEAHQTAPEKPADAGTAAQSVGEDTLQLGVRLAEAEAAATAARAEVAAVRASASWRVTAPLRALYDVVVSLQGGKRE